MPVERRKLSFASLDEVVAEAENLLARGYDRAGNWDLAQVAGHLANWLSYPVEGFPKVPLVLRPVVWLVRTTAGKRMRDGVLANGFAPGTRTVPETVPAAGGDAAAAVARLREAVERLKAHAGPIVPSPLFGPMDKDTAVRLQLRHCEHHLGFLTAK
ncbi:Uncharacterized protein OS=Leptonema illini DSM 21528 GN=Lepil_0134 PE=4 SV=1: DUF1569 [Gemmataceae bacterium]|nr:Uncharacterized protein OS=Leptonema illini DSM 21528 GN=Lepil_0134 PE=4 SV=1: DUF1569 [Gemmataceae bacterium]VTT97661.1 Uncharacterized protein OS=Leptonema illini DSM 21528 GN=Lepil_0134 PE=4 SV=1: DUF1569 [Gemmataceae bacterium]